MQIDDNFSESVPDGVTLSFCVPPDQWTKDSQPSGFRYHSAHTSFDLPISDSLFLVSRGVLSSGTVEIQVSSAIRNIIKVNVSVDYFRQDVRDKAHACLVHNTHGGTGVGIFVREPARDCGILLISISECSRQ